MVVATKASGCRGFATEKRPATGPGIVEERDIDLRFAFFNKSLDL
jgi:hypothetical protein